MQIIVKHYNHVNKAFANWDTPEGKLVKSKDHYDRLMKEQGMVSFEESQDRERNNKLKPYAVSEKTLEIIKAAKNSRDSKGNVRLSDRTIDAMKSMGAIGKKIPPHMQLPSHYTKKSGI